MCAATRVSSWLYPRPEGLYCEPGDFYIDPARAVPRAVVTHGHSDHARPDHAAVLATPETLGIMRVRMGERAGRAHQPLALGAPLDIGGVRVTLHPAGHILGSAQVALEHAGARVVVTGDYKRAPDPTCLPFEVVRSDVLVTEATFGLPVFRHEDAAREARRLIASLAGHPGRTHLLGVYGLGKCQRMIRLLRAAGYDRTIFLHGALQALCDFYEAQGQPLGALAPVAGMNARDLAGVLVLCPPSALADRWSRRMVDPLTAFASGWMRIRGRARQRGVELPLIVSDHADWPELIATIRDTGAEEIWVTHGREEALLHQIAAMGLKGRALALVGYEDEGE